MALGWKIHILAYETPKTITRQVGFPLSEDGRYILSVYLASSMLKQRSGTIGSCNRVSTCVDSVCYIENCINHSNIPLRLKYVRRYTICQIDSPSNTRPTISDDIQTRYILVRVAKYLTLSFVLSLVFRSLCSRNLRYSIS